MSSVYRIKLLNSVVGYVVTPVDRMMRLVVTIS